MKNTLLLPQNIKAIIGLGNPGSAYVKTRHNIGFRVVDSLVNQMHGTWNCTKDMATATVFLPESKITSPESPILVIKPMGFMNNSGIVVPYLSKKGIAPEQCLVIHDELEKKFGQLLFNHAGSAKGHNGLRSLIERMGAGFWRLKFGIGRPDDKAMVPDYVLAQFTLSENEQLGALIDQAVRMLMA